MEGVKGILKLKIKKGMNLAVRDVTRRTSDPYVVATLDHQKTKTKAARGDCNPVWDCDLTMAIKDPKVPIKLTVYDEDTFSHDDNMGIANVDINPYFKCLEMGTDDLHLLPVGTKLETVQPSDHNDLVEESYIIWNKDVITQDMLLRLNNVESGELEVQIQITHVDNRRLKIEDDEIVQV